MIRTFKHYTSAEAIIKILESSTFSTEHCLSKANDLLERVLLERISIEGIYGFCFSLRRGESIPMWKIYANGGCLLRITLKKSATLEDLIKNSRDIIKHGRIDYKNKNDFSSLVKNTNRIKENEKYLIKRSDFDFESEYRIVTKTNKLELDFTKCTIEIFYDPSIRSDSLESLKSSVEQINKGRRSKIKVSKSPLGDIFGEKK